MKVFDINGKEINPKEVEQGQLLNKRMQMVYPDGSIHYVDAYDFIEAKVEGEREYILFYNDYTNNPEGESFYTPLINIAGRWFKSSDYSFLEDKIEDIYNGKYPMRPRMYEELPEILLSVDEVKSRPKAKSSSLKTKIFGARTELKPEKNIPVINRSIFAVRSETSGRIDAFLPSGLIFDNDTDDRCSYNFKRVMLLPEEERAVRSTFPGNDINSHSMRITTPQTVPVPVKLTSGKTGYVHALMNPCVINDMIYPVTNLDIEKDKRLRYCDGMKVISTSKGDKSDLSYWINLEAGARGLKPMKIAKDYFDIKRSISKDAAIKEDFDDDEYPDSH